MRWVYAALILYATAFALTWPRVFLVVDEERYVSQAVAFAQGELTIPGAEIIHPPAATRLISDFPPGTSALQAPLVAAAGWRGAVVVSVVALVVATLATSRILLAAGMPPGFALVFPGFLGAAFFGRVAMSDLPGAALVAISLLLLWRAGGSWRTSFAAGLAAGATLLFREPLVLLLAPFVVGALARRSAVRWALLAGGAAAILARLITAWVLFGSPAYVRPSGYGFSAASLAHSVPVFAVILLVMLPLGAVLPAFYRGPRRAEAVTAVSGYVLLFLLYEYDSVRENGPVKGMLLASRYMIPALPLFALMAAEVWPRWHDRLVSRHPAARRLRLPLVAAAAAVLIAVAAHPLARAQEGAPLAIVRGIYANTTPVVPVITNTNATLKYLSPSYGPRRLILRHEISPDSAAQMAQALGGASLVLLDRTDSELFLAESAGNQAFVQRLSARCSVRSRADQPVASWARLRIWDVSGCHTP
jgi:hypothetical protein